ncbi:hypothetical protein [Pseudohongiella sp.]|uniref:Uncharacterized protein n=1 Tax=marine sediment metagenome TaxID=412755 RepID=A0A0F9W3G0_9ZZZZ|nr:hypothetical protein [Pseudohongiella sp.]HDZ09000.1 hypothetical protein [Pseudohongiella sp.]HEA62685.1 hypothetical protein [Pseudohongiella sp.]
MMIWDKSYFDSFGVTDGQTDTQFPHFDQADRIIIRSRENLASLTTDTIQSAIEKFDALYTDFYGESFHEHMGTRLLRDETSEDYQRYHPEVLDLLLIQDAYPIKNKPFNWGHLDAIIALNVIARAVTEDLSARDDQSSTIQIRNHEASEYLLLANEVLSLAEPAARPVTDNTQTLNARKAARAKHAPRDELKQEFFDWYARHDDKRTFTSKNQAAEKFYRSLPEHKRNLIAESNAKRFFTDALRAYLK